ncbi:MAG: class II glutamine amidotransferase [Nitrososphaerales archaeon]
MCRILGLLPRPSSRIDFELVKTFRSLASCGRVKPGAAAGHPDGWGIVIWENGMPVYLGREPTDAFSDRRFEVACNRGKEMRVTSALVAHLRKAPAGERTRDNTHPFVQSEWAFAHNGMIRKLNLKSKTDSEWFFQSLMEESRRCCGDIMTAIARQVETVKKVYQYSSMTFLLSNGHKLFAYRDCVSDQNYYTIFYARLNDSFVVAQEKFFEAPWKELGNGQLLIADGRLQHEIIDIAHVIPAD